VESSCEFNNEPSGSINAEKLSRGFTTGGLSNSVQLHRVSLYIFIILHNMAKGASASVLN
jgi:hypothetical protein